MISVLLLATIPLTSTIRERTTTDSVQKGLTINYSLLTTTGILVTKSVVERHNINTEQLDVLLNGIKESFSIAITIDSNDKLSWKMSLRYTTWYVTPLPFQYHPLGATNQIHAIPSFYHGIYSYSLRSSGRGARSERNQSAGFNMINAGCEASGALKSDDEVLTQTTAIDWDGNWDFAENYT